MLKWNGRRTCESSVDGFNGTFIDTIRYLLLLGVILIHCRFDLPGQGFGAAQLTMSFVSGTLASLCVPFYFLIAGFLFFHGVGKFDTSAYIRKLRKRVKTLFIPYFIWNIIGLICLLIKLLPSFRSYFPQYGVIEPDFVSILKGFWSFSLMSPSLVPYPYDFVLWFVRDLIVFNLLAPFFYVAARHLKIVVFPVLVFLAASGTAVPLMNPAMVFFYFTGAVIAIKGYSLGILYRYGKYCVLPAMLFAVLTEMQILPDCNIFRFMYCLTGICALSYLISRLLVRNFTIPKKITGSGFFIYAFHGLYVTLCVKAVLLAIKPDSSFGYVGCYVANFFVMYTLSTCVFYALKKLVPGVLSVMCGGRTG